MVQGHFPEMVFVYTLALPLFKGSKNSYVKRTPMEGGPSD